MRFLFVPWPESGHILPLLSIGNRLSRRGHRVRYLSFPWNEELLARAGVESVDWSALADFKPCRDGSSALIAYAEPLSDGSLAGSVCKLGVDLTLVDYLWAPLAVGLFGEGARGAIVYTNYPADPDPMSPVPGSAYIPRDTIWSRSRVRLAWRRFDLGRKYSSAIGRPPWEDLYRPIYRALTSRFGFPTHAIDFRAGLAPHLALPSLVVAPWDLEFPRGCPPNRYYVEPSIRPAGLGGDDFPWHALSEECQLLYCAFGTQSGRYRSTPLRELVEGLIDDERFLGWRIVLVAPEADPVIRDGRAARLIRVTRAPQLELLGRARVALLHGGMGSIKEALFHGVPLLVAPFAYDQPSNAARVCYHRVGDYIHPRRIRPSELAGRILGIVSSPEILSNVSHMQVRLRALEEVSPSVRQLEDFAAMSVTDFYGGIDVRDARS